MSKPRGAKLETRRSLLIAERKPRLVEDHLFLFFDPTSIIIHTDTSTRLTYSLLSTATLVIRPISVYHTLSDMSDSPFYKSPIDPIERPILDKLVRIRDNLELLKSDKSKHIRSQDVVTYYDQIIQQVHALNEIRTTKREEQNRCRWTSAGK
jgi:hypothetical protein